MIRLNNRYLQSSWKLISHQFSERKYCVWATPYLKHLSHPLSVLTLAAFASLLCGIFVAPQGFVFFASIISVITIGCIWPWIGIRGVSCQLRFIADRTEEGKAAEAELVITNRWPWPVWGLAIEGGLNPVGQLDEQAAIAVSRIGGWSRGHYRWKFIPAMRGRYPVSSPQIITEFPFGMWRAHRQVEVLSNLIVWPERFPLPPLALPSGTQSWVGQPSECAAGNLGHRTTVREYRQGDSMRQIHWAKTALYDKLVSYEREGLAVSDAMITLDTHSSLHRGSGADSTLECSIRIAASICDALLLQGVNITVIAQGDTFSSQALNSNPVAHLDWFALLGSNENLAKEQTVPRCVSNQKQAMSVHITTDKSRSAEGDSIVLLTGADTSCEARDNLPARCWMVIKQGANIPSQIRGGWRSGPRSRRHAI